MKFSSTGADPSRHGIVANDWIDQQSGEFVYNTEDERYHIIGREPKAHEGVSPRNLLASTIADELFVHSVGSAGLPVTGKDVVGQTAFQSASLPKQGLIQVTQDAPAQVVGRMLTYMPHRMNPSAGRIWPPLDILI